jgi:hypothetical protein
MVGSWLIVASDGNKSGTENLAAMQVRDSRYGA